jgi:hypothetical protein
MGYQFLEQQINIKFCVKLEKNANDTCAVLSEAYGGEAMKSQLLLNGMNGSERKSIAFEWHKWFREGHKHGR